MWGEVHLHLYSAWGANPWKAAEDEMKLPDSKELMQASSPQTKEGRLSKLDEDYQALDLELQYSCTIERLAVKWDNSARHYDLTHTWFTVWIECKWSFGVISFLYLN